MPKKHFAKGLDGRMRVTRVDLSPENCASVILESSELR